MNIIYYWSQIRESLPDTNDFLRFLALFLLSFVVPIGIFVGRNNIRASRRQIVRDLEKLFSFAGLPNGKKLILPSFELVKYKYDPKSDPNRDTKDNPYSFYYYVLPVPIYIVLVLLFFSHGVRASRSSSPQTILLSPFGVPLYPGRELSGVLTYSFLGAYVWTIQYLIRRISNFDLAPISFFKSVCHILLAEFTMVALWQSGVFAKLPDQRSRRRSVRAALTAKSIAPAPPNRGRDCDPGAERRQDQGSRRRNPPPPRPAGRTTQAPQTSPRSSGIARLHIGYGVEARPRNRACGPAVAFAIRLGELSGNDSPPRRPG